MTIWTSLFLFLVVVLTWSLHVFRNALQLAIEDAHKGLAENQRRGVSILPGIPLIPLSFVGIAALIDVWHSPYGTLFVAGLHIVYTMILVVLIARGRRLYRQIESRS